jgi:hypothetical protein
MKTSFEKFMNSNAVKVELGEVKVELNLLSDGADLAKQLNDLAFELKGNKKDISTTMRRIEGLTQDGIEVFKALQRVKARLESINKESGLKAEFPPIVENAMNAWADANSLKI